MTAAPRPSWMEPLWTIEETRSGGWRINWRQTWKEYADWLQQEVRLGNMTRERAAEIIADKEAIIKGWKAEARKIRAAGLHDSSKT